MGAINLLLYSPKGLSFGFRTAFCVDAHDLHKTQPEINLLVRVGVLIHFLLDHPGGMYNTRVLYAPHPSGKNSLYILIVRIFISNVKLIHIN